MKPIFCSASPTANDPITAFAVSCDDNSRQGDGNRPARVLTPSSSRSQPLPKRSLAFGTDQPGRHYIACALPWRPSSNHDPGFARLYFGETGVHCTPEVYDQMGFNDQGWWQWPHAPEAFSIRYQDEHGNWLRSRYR